MLFPLLALIVAIATAAGSLYLTLELGHKTCMLCFYQRAFAFALVGVLASGLLNQPVNVPWWNDRALRMIG